MKAYVLFLWSRRSDSRITRCTGLIHGRANLRMNTTIRESGSYTRISVRQLRRIRRRTLRRLCPVSAFQFATHRLRERQDADLAASQFGRLVEAVAEIRADRESIVRVRGFSTLRRFLRSWIKMTTGAFPILDAKHYGVPQNRPQAPRPFASWLDDIAYAAAGFPAIVAGEHHPDIPNHIAASITELNGPAESNAA